MDFADAPALAPHGAGLRDRARRSRACSTGCSTPPAGPRAPATPRAGPGRARRAPSTARFWDVTLPAERRARSAGSSCSTPRCIVLPLADRQAYLERYAEPDKAATGLADGGALAGAVLARRHRLRHDAPAAGRRRRGPRRAVLRRVPERCRSCWPTSASRPGTTWSAPSPSATRCPTSRAAPSSGPRPARRGRPPRRLVTDAAPVEDRRRRARAGERPRQRRGLPAELRRRGPRPSSTGAWHDVVSADVGEAVGSRASHSGEA